MQHGATPSCSALAFLHHHTLAALRCIHYEHTAISLFVSCVCRVILIWLSVASAALCVLLQTNPSKGWWEEFIGPGRALDTNQYYVVCSNIIGGCYGSSGPSSTNPTTGAIYYIQYQSIHNSTKLDLLLKTYSMP